ncbi:MAG: hypothetical protein U5L09_14395 [Bacteroidales bacterium]|nr:hypothetical protein [Bacteroidales bacterium]
MPQDGAIIEYPETMGQISSYALDGREALIEGTLKIGEAMAVPVIQATKKSLHALDAEIRLIDATSRNQLSGYGNYSGC